MKRNILRLGTWVASLAFLGALLTGCAWSIGDGHHGPPVQNVQPTRGQELMDLKKARDQGAITEEEYQAQKQRLLNK